MAERRTGGGGGGRRAARTKAQEEFSQYKERAAASGPTAGPRVAIPLAQGGAPAWSVPPAVVMAPPAAGGQGAPAGPGLAGTAQGLGDTIRLGIDVLNAALAGGARLLGGATTLAADLGYGAGELDGYGHECGCGHGYDGCHDCCDCCDALGCGCGCHPGVGSCC
jgi:hypothetical protein